MKLLWTEERKNCFEDGDCPFLSVKPVIEGNTISHTFKCKRDQHVVFVPPDDEIPEGFVPTPENVEALKIKQNQEWEAQLKRYMENLFCPLEQK